MLATANLSISETQERVRNVVLLEGRLDAWRYRWRELKPEHCIELGDRVITKLESMEVAEAQEFLRKLGTDKKQGAKLSSSQGIIVDKPGCSGFSPDAMCSTFSDTQEHRLTSILCHIAIQAGACLLLTVKMGFTHVSDG